MKITFGGGKTIESEKPQKASEILKKFSEGLYHNALCVKVDGALKDLNTVLDKDCELDAVTFKEEEGKRVYWHTTAHIMAQAVKNIFPTCKLAIGPATDAGFYYDFDFKTPITQDDLVKIEEEMSRIIKADFEFERKEVTKAAALKEMKKFDEPYKQELVMDIPDGDTVSLYKQGAFVDLCRGPHLPATGKVKAFKLLNVTGAYWRGNEKNKMLTRIYGISFDKKSDLTEYLEKIEEAKKRDHNKLGRELGIFMTEETIGQGLPLLMPKGAKLYQILTRFVEDEEEKRGYLLTKTPYMAKSDLYKVSGHWDHYKDKMFVLGDESKGDEAMALRPMTCPFQYMIYKNGLKSYRDLPKRYAETSTLFRKEASGEMHGLIRVRQFTLSDGHIVCMPSQLEEEFKGCLELTYYILDSLGLRDDIYFRFSKWDPKDPDKYINDPKAWEAAERTMKTILDDLGLKYEEATGEAAFYGPKLDIQTRNVYGKEDTLITIQVDMFLAENFDMSFIDQDGNKKRPYIIHRSSLGCYERTIAMLIEKYAGAFPLWMSPVQAKVLSITDRTADYAKEISDRLSALGIRTETDLRSEKIGYKIREARLDKVPYMIIVGDKEQESGTLSVRERGENGELGNMTFDEFVKRVQQEISEKIIQK